MGIVCRMFETVWNMLLTGVGGGWGRGSEGVLQPLSARNLGETSHPYGM